MTEAGVDDRDERLGMTEGPQPRGPGRAGTARGSVSGARTAADQQERKQNDREFTEDRELTEEERNLVPAASVDEIALKL